MHMADQVGGAKHRIHIGLGAHSGYRRALPHPTRASRRGPAPASHPGADARWATMASRAQLPRSIGGHLAVDKNGDQSRIHEAAPR